jgi:SAM-dependent methyltransferase
MRLHADSLDIYFQGKKLFGDDFSTDEIQEWFEDEKEGYANLGSKNIETYVYGYNELNRQYGYKFLSKAKYHKVLGFGSAYGDELLPIINKVGSITILEPSDAFVNSNLRGVPLTYIKPESNGTLPFNDNSYDLITCLGVLHHIPNVSKVISELSRCLQPGGILLLREPTVSMGDWRKSRNGVTKRERGIPFELFREMIGSTSLKIINEQRFDFSLTSRLYPLVRKSVYNSKLCLYLDRIACKMFFYNKIYHATNSIQKLRPSSVYYVLTK